MTTVCEINDPAELVALSPLWNELLERTPGASFFHSLTWLQTYWKHFGSDKRLRVLVVRDGDHVIGFLPLVVRTARQSEPVRALTYPLDEMANYYGPIGPDPLTILIAGLDHVRRTPRDWCFIELAWVDSLADGGRTKRAFDNAGFTVTCETQETCAIVDLTEHRTWEAYLATRTSSWRKDLRRKEKRLARRGAVTFVRHRTTGTEASQANPRWDLYEACEAISRASWQSSARKGRALSKGTDRSYYRDFHVAATRSGVVDLGLLLIDDRPVAFQYNCYYRGCLTTLSIAYDPAFTHEGAGAVLQARTLADSFARGDHIVDLGPDSADRHKQDWLTESRPVSRYTHFPPHAAVAQVVRCKRAIERRLRVAKRVVERPLRATVRRYRPISTSGR